MKHAIDSEEADAAGVAAHGEDHPIDAFGHLGLDLHPEVAVAHVRRLAFRDPCESLRTGSIRCWCDASLLRIEHREEAGTNGQDLVFLRHLHEERLEFLQLVRVVGRQVVRQRVVLASIE